MPDLGDAARQRVASTPRVELDESELVRRAQLGSAMAFDQLVVRRGSDLYRYLLMRLRNESDAQDALQETMTAAWQALPGLRQPDKFWPWLLAIGTRKATAVARGRSPANPLELDVPGADASGLLEIWDAVSRLPARHRDVLILRYRLDLSEEEAAETLGIRVGTVKSRCARGRRALTGLLR